MNLLILSCGTRNKLVHYFKEQENGFDKVVTTDCSIYAPALYDADRHYIVPRITEDNYVETILDICKEEKINVIIPLLEEELVLISSQKKKFEEMGIMIVLSDQKNILLCQDKYLFAECLREIGIPYIETELYQEYIGKNYMPVFVKPRLGAGSIGTMKINTPELLDAFIKDSETEYVIQPYLDATEYGVDAYVDYHTGELVSVFIKEKIRMRAGETEKSVSVINYEITELIEKLVKSLSGLRGPIDIDILAKKERYYVLEVNPRFGGGYPHAYECGVNFPKLIANNAKGLANEKKVSNYKEGIIALKYSEIKVIG